VQARKENGRLCINVYNDGPALPEGWLPERASGIGLRNTAMRLRHLYGDAGRLDVANQDAGVVAEMSLPYHV
jgi:sensor histidine kinase YesM